MCQLLYSKTLQFLAEKSVTFSFIKPWCVQMENKFMAVKSFAQSHKESLGYAQDYNSPWSKFLAQPLWT